MAGDNTVYNVPFRAPALPYAPQVYNQETFEQFNNVLRIYFNQLDNALRNAMAVQEPYELQVAKGQIAGASTLYKFGTNPDVDGTEETVWSTGGNYPWPAAAFTAFISSSSAADTSAGTGAQTVTVEGVDGTAAGTIYVANSGVSSGVPTGITYGQIVQGDNQSQMSVYTVPAGFTLFLDDVTFTAAIAIANKNVTAKFVTRDFGSNTFRTKIIQTVQSNLLVLPFNYPLGIAEKTDIECRASSDTTNVEVGASFQGVLIAN